MKKFKLLSDSTITDAKTGDIVYECVKHDYGTASDDTRLRGYPHISVTKSDKGDYPFFTHPVTGLQEIK